MSAVKIVIVGYGKIAQDQHVPSIAANPRFELAATVSRGRNAPDGVPCFSTVTEAVQAVEGIGAAAVCTPPSVRYDIARECIAAGLHTLLEKPPGVTLGEVEELARQAEAKGVTLFTTWHAQDNPAVPTAQKLLAGKTVTRMRIYWHEDVRKWHPGQAWIQQPGGFGVFDPGINALSIATRIFPGTLFVRDAELFFPENWQTPIAALLRLGDPEGKAEIEADFDWRHSGGEAWTIDIETEGGDSFQLRDGGARMTHNGEEVASPGEGEYPAIYRQFAELIDAGKSHVDLEPLRLTADAFLLGRRTVVERFEA
jgi:D-galactose 1-dehydrogenase